LSVISTLATSGAESERGWADIEWGWLLMTAYGDLDGGRRHCLRGLSHAGELTESAEICLIET
jgi:hypothetical protein